MEFPFREIHGSKVSGSFVFEDRNTGIPEQNVHVNNQTLTTAQIESMKRQPVYSDPDLQGVNSGCNHSTNLISSEQDLQGTNRTGTAAETELMMMRRQQSVQRQPAEIYSADSSDQNRAETEHMTRQQQSGQRQLPDISTADSPAVQLGRIREAKRKADQKYRERKKKKLEDMELEVRSMEAEREKFEAESKSLRQQFEAENKSLKEQLDFANQGCETKQRELVKLGEDFTELEKKYNKQQEQQADMELKVTTLAAENRRLKDKYIELLEKSNPLMDPRFGTQSKESGRQHGQTTNLASERDFGSSGIDSITQ